MSIQPVNIDEIRPSTRLTDRRSGIINNYKPKKRTTTVLCTDCYFSIYDNEDYYFCQNCHGKLCVGCLKNNTKCPACNSKIQKFTTSVPVKQAKYSCLWKLFRKFTKWPYCLPNHPNI
jgi:rubrerythrin